MSRSAKSAIQHINDLSGPPEIGRYYLVPTVTAIWHGKHGEWPVIGPLHSDRQHLKFDREHYHLDTRFLRDTSADWFIPDEFWLQAHASPIMRTWTGSSYDKPSPRSVAAVYPRRWVCKRHATSRDSAFVSEIQRAVRRQGGPDSPASNWAAHLDYWTGRQCRNDGNGWVCPHRNVPLGSQPVIDGVVRCPLHGLMISHETGKVLSREEMRSFIANTMPQEHASCP